MRRILAALIPLVLVCIVRAEEVEPIVLEPVDVTPVDITPIGEDSFAGPTGATGAVEGSTGAIEASTGVSGPTEGATGVTGLEGPISLPDFNPAEIEKHRATLRKALFDQKTAAPTVIALAPRLNDAATVLDLLQAVGNMGDCAKRAPEFYEAVGYALRQMDSPEVREALLGAAKDRRIQASGIAIANEVLGDMNIPYDVGDYVKAGELHPFIARREALLAGLEYRKSPRSPPSPQAASGRPRRRIPGPTR